ncbi:MAG: asparagine synthase (glutamine-hydrolyzing) [Cyanobacteria bacterium J06633_8]
MCGIAGIIRTESDNYNLEPPIHSMRKALNHRGPDDSGIYISQNGQVTLAHTRLAILDLSSAGHQPMSVNDGRYYIVFNGEIYNFQELRENLLSPDEQFNSRTDTEVILKLYQKLGSDCVHHLRGMFAFAIWDNYEKTCFIARDPLGIKPLYYWLSGSKLIFASELRAILASGLPEIKLSQEGLYGYLTSGSVPEPHTLIEGVHCLEAGHWLHWQAGNLRKSQYWQINFAPEYTTVSESIARVREALIDSVKHHFVSDVPVGVFLSGGIDSSAIVSLSREVESGSLNTFSIVFDEQEWNEGDLAQRVAEKFGTHHTEYKITASVGKSLLPKYLDSIDQPSMDGFNTFCVSKIAHESGMKVVLSGLGGDEFFGGYKSFQKIPQMIRLSQQLQPIKPLVKSVGMGMERWGSSIKVRRLGDFLQQAPNSATAYRTFRGIFSHWEACQILKYYFPDHKILSQSRQSIEDINANQYSVADEVSKLEIGNYMRNQLLKDSDVMSMSWGLELRVPLVDRILLESIATIPSEIRLAAGKQLLIKAVGNLPDWIINRPKTGFSFPFERWMNSEWQDYFQEINCPSNVLLTSWYRRWSLAILQHWLQKISN